MVHKKQPGDTENVYVTRHRDRDKVKRVEWLGHVVRMKVTRLPEMVIKGKPKGRRGVGRTILRWLDYVEADIKALGINKWRIKAQDRKQWSANLREAEAKAKLQGP
jgi:hypothetical protein